MSEEAWIIFYMRRIDNNSRKERNIIKKRVVLYKQNQLIFLGRVK
jgi:hypothetical protein